MKFLEFADADAQVAPGAFASAMVEVTNSRHIATSDTLVVTVEDSDGQVYAPATTEVTRLYTGFYRVDVGTLGLDIYDVQITGTDMHLVWQVDASGGVPVPDVDDITAYLKTAAAQYTTEQIADALAAETSRQRDNCTIPAVYPASLADALRRRTARNLAAQALPLAYRLDPDGAAIRLAGEDAIVKSIEAHYPRSGAA